MIMLTQKLDTMKNHSKTLFLLYIKSKILSQECKFGEVCGY